MATMLVIAPMLEANDSSGLRPDGGNSSMRQVTTHHPEAGSILYMTIGLIGLIISTTCLTLRVSTTRQTTSLRHLSPSHILVIAVMFLGVSFSVSTMFLYFGLGIYKEQICGSTMVLCLVFYLGQKYALYLFLVERTHVTQANKKSRTKDPIYIAGLAFIVIGFSAIGISAFATFHYNFSDGCKIGLLRPVAITVLSWDIFVNVFLTSVFLYCIQSFLVDGFIMTLSPIFLRPVIMYLRGKDSPETLAVAQNNLVHVIRKTTWASVGILVTTVANFAILLIFAGNEPVWLCFSLCTFDINWAVIIIFWLTEAAPASRSAPRTKNEGQSQTRSNH